MNQQLIPLLYWILRRQDSPLKEYDLLFKLARKKVSPFALMIDKRDVRMTSHHLFQLHFILFHHLYLLRKRLREKGSYDLHIHCLSIELQPMLRGLSTTSLDRVDPLEQYYLDWDEMVTTSHDDVDKMIQFFMKKYHNHTQRANALKVLGLSPEASEEEIKRQFRKLVKIHHPDCDGEAEEFIEVARAKEVLLDSF